jgi:hypothetical protein
MTELRQGAGGLPQPAEAEGIWTSIWHQEAHHSTAKGLPGLPGRPGPLRVRLRQMAAEDRTASQPRSQDTTATTTANRSTPPKMTE